MGVCTRLADGADYGVFALLCCERSPDSVLACTQVLQTVLTTLRVYSQVLQTVLTIVSEASLLQADTTVRCVMVAVL